ncbi:MAG: hypothetical protein HC772_04960 [Leptolyngbyaceae cyanobacterium CRU_2_3]|nr:hypothetical protein [Leptolyngbyaceae cyanobacterium CRU_2_3]
MTSLPGGGFVVTWSSNADETTGGSGNGVFIKRYSAQGIPLEDQQIQVNTTTLGDQYFSSVAADQNGNLAVVWTSEEQDTSEGGVYAQRFTSTDNINVAPTDLTIAPRYHY